MSDLFASWMGVYAEIEQTYLENSQQTATLAKTTWQLLESLPNKTIKQLARRKLNAILKHEHEINAEIEKQLLTFKKELDYYGFNDSSFILFDRYDALYHKKIKSKKLRILERVIEAALYKELECTPPYLVSKLFFNHFSYRKITKKITELEQPSCEYRGSCY